jgi:Delta7-sterol 5-desaturase
MDTTSAAAWSDPAAWLALVRFFVGQMMVEGTRYAVAAALVFVALHVLLRRRLAHRLILAWPTARDVRREMTHSALTLLVFAALGTAVIGGMFSGHITIYRDPARYGWWWLVLSLPLMIVWHDFYFYWTHRLLHTRWLLRHVHGVHHRSRNPSPWAAYAFHPVEALINGLVTPLALLMLPLHWSVLMLFALHQIVRNAIGHAAVEVLPRAFATHWLGRHFTTTTHHHLHHETAQGHYGLWFTWWDRWMGTERADYLVRYAQATPPRPGQPASQAAGAASAASIA